MSAEKEVLIPTCYRWGPVTTAGVVSWRRHHRLLSWIPKRASNQGDTYGDEDGHSRSGSSVWGVDQGGLRSKRPPADGSVRKTSRNVLGHERAPAGAFQHRTARVFVFVDLSVRYLDLISASFLAETSVSSPRQLFIFII